MMFISDDISFYYQTKIPIGFWYKRKLNFRSFTNQHHIYLSSQAIPILLYALMFIYE